MLTRSYQHVSLLFSSILIIIFSLYFSACNGNNKILEVIEENAKLQQLEQNQQLWDNQNINSYQITSQTICFCPSPNEMVITVEEENISEAFYTISGEYLTAQELEYVLTINQHFEIIRDAINQEAFSLDVTYEPTFGYPTEISIDYIEMTVDDEITYLLSSLQ